MNHATRLAALSDDNGDMIRAGCPVCRSSTSVVTDTRPWHASIKRRRKCVGCGHRWTTIELPADLAERLPAMEEDLKQIARIAETMAEILAEIVRRLP